MATLIVIAHGHGLGLVSVVDKLALYKVLIHCNSRLKQLYLSNMTERFSYKGGCGICEHMHTELFKRKAELGYR